MAGEYKIAQDLIEQTMQDAEANPQSSAEAMGNALLGALLQKLVNQRGKKDLEQYISFQLENMSEDEFVVTRGC